MPRLRPVLLALAVLLASCSPTATADRPPPRLVSYVHTAATGREWQQLADAADAQGRWYAAQASVGAWYEWAAGLPRPNAERPSSGYVGAAAVAEPTGGSHRGYATAHECVADTENGGSYEQGSNRTHRGRYQFGRPAWISFGGDPAHWDDWTLASPAEQDTVFDTAWSQGPEVQWQQWLRWDGC